MKFYTNFPREVGKYRQWKANSISDLLHYVNKYNGKQDLYTSVYGFEEWFNGRPNYNSAIIDRIYCDIDPYYTDNGT